MYPPGLIQQMREELASAGFQALATTAAVRADLCAMFDQHLSEN